MIGGKVGERDLDGGSGDREGDAAAVESRSPGGIDELCVMFESGGVQCGLAGGFVEEPVADKTVGPAVLGGGREDGVVGEVGDVANGKGVEDVGGVGRGCEGNGSVVERQGSGSDGDTVRDGVIVGVLGGIGFE